MSSLLQVIIFATIGGVVSLIGGVLLLASKKHAVKLAGYATPFAAGALLAAAFIDLLGDAAHEDQAEPALLFALIGILASFLLERFLHWFHHRRVDHSDRDAKIPLIIVSGVLHNAIDGVAIAAGFLVSPAVGIVVTTAVAAHEIPHEIGDFGLLLSKKMARGRVLIVNLLSSLATVIAAAVVFILGQNVEIPLGAVLGLTAGFFIYIAVSDIIPDIHAREDKRFVGWQSVLLIFGVILVSLASFSLHQLVGE